MNPKDVTESKVLSGRINNDPLLQQWLQSTTSPPNGVQQGIDKLLSTHPKLLNFFFYDPDLKIVGQHIEMGVNWPSVQYLMELKKQQKWPVTTLSLPTNVLVQLPLHAIIHVFQHPDIVDELYFTGLGIQSMDEGARELAENVFIQEVKNEVEWIGKTTNPSFQDYTREWIDISEPVKPDILAPEVEGNILAPGTGGNILAPGAGGNILAPGTGGNILASGAGGNILAPGAGGNILAPGAGGNILAPGTGKNILAPEGQGVVTAANAAFWKGRNTRRIVAEGPSKQSNTCMTAIFGKTKTFVYARIYYESKGPNPSGSFGSVETWIHVPDNVLGDMTQNYASIWPTLRFLYLDSQSALPKTTQIHLTLAGPLASLPNLARLRSIVRTLLKHDAVAVKHISSNRDFDMSIDAYRILTRIYQGASAVQIQTLEQYFVPVYQLQVSPTDGMRWFLKGVHMDLFRWGQFMAAHIDFGEWLCILVCIIRDLLTGLQYLWTQFHACHTDVKLANSAILFGKFGFYWVDLDCFSVLDQESRMCATYLDTYQLGDSNGELFHTITNQKGELVYITTINTFLGDLYRFGLMIQLLYTGMTSHHVGIPTHPGHDNVKLKELQKNHLYYEAATTAHMLEALQMSLDSTDPIIKEAEQIVHNAIRLRLGKPIGDRDKASIVLIDRANKFLTTYPMLPEKWNKSLEWTTRSISFASSVSFFCVPTLSL